MSENMDLKSPQYRHFSRSELVSVFQNEHMNKIQSCLLSNIEYTLIILKNLMNLKQILVKMLVNYVSEN